MKISRVIDDCLIPHGSWKGLSFGNLTVVFILYLLERPHPLYRMEDWIKQRPYLKSLYPDISSKDFTDDRLGILLDRINAFGVRKLYNKISLEIIEGFSIDLNHIHFDLTNFSLYGKYDKQGSDKQPFEITFGYSKSGRKDLKQVNLGVGVSNDGGIPLGMQTYDGNTADVDVYVPFWNHLSECLGRSDFLFIADSKLTSIENLLAISKAQGYYLAPLGMYAGITTKLEQWVIIEGQQHLVLKINKKKEVLYKGFEIPGTLLDEQTGEEYLFRHCVIWSKSLEYTRTKGIVARLEKASLELEDLKSKLNKRKLVSKQAIEQRIEKIRSKNKVKGLIEVEVNSTIVTQKKQIGLGRPHPKTKYKLTKEEVFEITYSIKENQVQAAKDIAGYYVMVTNQTEEKLSLQEAFDYYKQEYKVEDIFRRLKGNVLKTVPMYLQLPQRINAMLFILTLSVQLLTLMDRQAAQFLADKEAELAGLFPNKITTARPKAEMLMDAFQDINIIEVHTKNDKIYYMSSLSPLQNKILEILQIDSQLYNQTRVINLIQKLIPI